MQRFSWRRPFVQVSTFVNNLFLNTVLFQVVLYMLREILFSTILTKYSNRQVSDCDRNVIETYDWILFLGRYSVVLLTFVTWFESANSLDYLGPGGSHSHRHQIKARRRMANKSTITKLNVGAHTPFSQCLILNELFSFHVLH